jgi:hypothetical protein
MADRGRTPGFVMSVEHRDKIKNSNILSYLIDHAEGKREMSPTQASVGLGLLKKVLPDLNSNTHAGDPENNTPIGVRWMNSPDEKL